MQMQQARKSSYKGCLMKWHKLSVEVVSNQTNYTHLEQADQNNDAKHNNSLGIRTSIVSMPDFHCQFHSQMS